MLPASAAGPKPGTYRSAATTANGAGPGPRHRSKRPCRFFANGHCAKPATCQYAHETQAEPAPPYLANCPNWPERRCAQGSWCPYRHDNDSSLLQCNAAEAVGVPRYLCQRDMDGAIVTFGDGAVVDGIFFSTDYTAVRLTNVCEGTPHDFVVREFRLAGEPIRESSVALSVAPDGKRFGIVCGGDAEFPRRVCANANLQLVFAPQRLAVPAVNANELASMPTTPYNRVTSAKVQVSWPKMLRTAKLYFFNGIKAERAAKYIRSSRFTIHGHRVSASAKKSADLGGTHAQDQPLKNGYQGNQHKAWVVTLRQVPPMATRKGILDALPKDIGASGIEFAELSAPPPSDTEALEHLLRTFAKLIQNEHGILTAGLREQSRSIGLTHKAYAVFARAADAGRVADELNGSRLPFPAHGADRLTVKVVHTVRIKVRQTVFRAANPVIEARASAWKRCGIDYKNYDPENPAIHTLWLESIHRRHLAEAKRELDAILRGRVMQMSDVTDAPEQSDGPPKPFWPPVFHLASARVRNTMMELEHALAVGIVVDRRNKEVRIVGTCKQQDTAEKALWAWFRQLPPILRRGHALTLSKDELEWVTKHHGLPSIKAMLGDDHVAMEAHLEPPQIRVAHEWMLDKVRALLASEAGRTVSTASTEPTDDDAACPVCLCEPEEPVAIPCGHVYCGACFGNLCQANVKRGIVCVGRGAECGTKVPLGVMEAHLPRADFEGVLEAAFDAHLSSHTDEIRHCATPDCPQIYRAVGAPASQSALAEVFTCPTCLAPVCLGCDVVHEGQSCAEYRYETTGAADEFMRAKAAMGIHDCPKCKTPIERIDGCNHVMCEQCQTHICWRCFTTTASGPDMYVHLDQEHGGPYDFQAQQGEAQGED